MKKINMTDVFSSIKENWQPTIIATVNGQILSAIKGEGELGWHKHDDQDKLITVFRGQLILEFKTEQVILNAGEMCVVPKGVEHCPKTQGETHFTLLEPHHP